PSSLPLARSPPPPPIYRSDIHPYHHLPHTLASPPPPTSCNRSRTLMPHLAPSLSHLWQGRHHPPHVYRFHTLMAPPTTMSPTSG
uniref:Uncharacterized protein n=1 Tax=Aegilops tauschii subsp. strangulata TaxID=200361 RepID=A0A453GBB4_AEGTS